jgi:hypothetical protein
MREIPEIREREKRERERERERDAWVLTSGHDQSVCRVQYH